MGSENVCKMARTHKIRVKPDNVLYKVRVKPYNYRRTHKKMGANL
jgi:hypothetical protein